MSISLKKTSMRSGLSRFLIASIILCAIAFTTFGLIHRGNTGRVTGDGEPSTFVNAIALQSRSPGERTEAELVTLMPTGFEPEELTRPAGRFLLSVNNRSGLAELSLLIQREDRSTAESKRVGKEKVWRKPIDLPPGRYLLREANHPEWQCRITITRN